MTVIGISIGVTAVIGLMSISLGLTQAVSETVDKLGQNTLMISPGVAGMASTVFSSFNDADLKVVEGVSGVNRVVPRYIGLVPVKFKGQTVDRRIAGIRPLDFDYTVNEKGSLKLMSGKLFSEGKQVVLGRNAWRDMDRPNLGQSVEIGGEKFKIVGVLDSAGIPFADSVIFMPLEQAWTLKKVEEYSLLTAFVSDISVSDRIKNKLENFRGKDTFSIMTNKQLAEQAAEILDIINGFLLAITGVSVIVGAFGIANTMFVSITERISQIGVMKTLGATNDQIVSLVLQEAAVLGVLGGIIGCILGVILGQIIKFVASLYEVKLYSYVPGWVFVVTIVLTAILGVISGVLPAREAANLDPVEALKL